MESMFKYDKTTGANSIDFSALFTDKNILVIRIIMLQQLLYKKLLFLTDFKRSFESSFLIIIEYLGFHLYRFYVK